MVETKDLMTAEHVALVELLGTLTPQEWSTPSLCSGWTVQDVAAHVAWMPALPMQSAARELAKSRFDVNRMIAETARRWAERGPAAILEQLRRNIASQAVPLGTTPLIGLADAVIHQLDIRRPLHRPRQVPAAAFAAVADLQVRLRWPKSLVVGGNVRRRVRGLELVATDAPWTHGTGLALRGTSESLLLLLTGRHVSPTEFTGPGVIRLAHQS